MRTGGKNILRHHALGQRFDPLILRAETLVEPGSNGAPNNNALINPSGEPWEIHEIKFGVRRESDVALARASGASLDVSLSWCGKPITDGFVPVWSTCPIQAVEEFRGGDDVSSANTGELWLQLDSFYHWRLEHPLFMPPRTAIAVEFRNNGIVNNNIRASISLIGRVMPRSARPIKVKVPYVSSWKSSTWYIGTTGEETSPETVLFNQFGVPLTVERFVGRVAQRIQTLESGVTHVYVDQDVRLGWRGNQFDVKHRMTDGNFVAKNWVKFGDIYGWRNFKWNMRHTLDAGVGHVIDLRKNDIDGPTANAEIVEATAQAAVSMIGWREENVP